MSERAEVVRAARDLVDQGRFVSELAALVSCPTESQNPLRQGAGDLPAAVRNRDRYK